MKTRINIKPLSVNQCWQGRRFKTPAYKYYEDAVKALLPNKRIPKSPKLEIHIEFGFSSHSADYDNAIKPFQDILQKRYNFDDNRIYKATIVKKVVKRGKEYIQFEIKAMK